MNDWRIEYSHNALSDLSKIDRPQCRQIIDKLEWLVSNFDEIVPSPLHGEWKGFFKFRIGDWRVVYDFESSKRFIRVHQIDRRDKIYKRHK